jgi:hypothetical protein
MGIQSCIMHMLRVFVGMACGLLYLVVVLLLPVPTARGLISRGANTCTHWHGCRACRGCHPLQYKMLAQLKLACLM